MKRLLVLLMTAACALCLAFGFAGCTSGENGESSSGSSTQQSGFADHAHSYLYKCNQTEHWQECTNCGKKIYIAAHTVLDGVCHTCGYVEKCTEGLEFTEIKEGEEIIGYSVSQGTATNSYIYIPSFTNGLPVISIDRHAFYQCTNLESISIGNSVTSIGWEAFYKCTNLTSITIPDSVTEIGYRAFKGCTNLASLTIPNSITSIDFYAFSNCTSLQSV